MYYTEDFRPQYHFSPESRWMNDPNGMVYANGEWHLFYQYHPESMVWGPMHWGHAVSNDLVHWEHLPVALYPDSLGMIFSGSAVLDANNTAGFQQGDTPALVAIFTYHLPKGPRTDKDIQSQGIAFSTDWGRSWTKYAGNPVIPNPGLQDFRDPKVFWHAPTQRWVMILAAGDRMRLYHSPNLKAWTYASEFGAQLGAHGGVWECPDLFPLPIIGTTETRWVMLVSINPGGPNGGSATQYFIGQFDGQTFTPELPTDSTSLWVDYGRDNYAGVTWSNAPADRRVFMGWMSNWQYGQEVPTNPWRSAMTIPRRLELRQTPAGPRLASVPVAELEQLREKPVKLDTALVSDTLFIKQAPYNLSTSEIVLRLAVPTDTTTVCGLRLGNDQGDLLEIGYNARRRSFFIDRRKSGLTAFKKEFAPAVDFGPRWSNAPEITLRVFIDKASVEVFADDGLTVMTNIVFPREEYRQAWLFSRHGTTAFLGGEWWALRNSWRRQPTAAKLLGN